MEIREFFAEFLMAVCLALRNATPTGRHLHLFFQDRVIPRYAILCLPLSPEDRDSVVGRTWVFGRYSGTSAILPARVWRAEKYSGMGLFNWDADLCGE